MTRPRVPLSKKRHDPVVKGKPRRPADKVGGGREDLDHRVVEGDVVPELEIADEGGFEIFRPPEGADLKSQVIYRNRVLVYRKSRKSRR